MFLFALQRLNFFIFALFCFCPGHKAKHAIIIGVLAGITALSIMTMVILILWRRKRGNQTSKVFLNSASRRSVPRDLSKRSTLSLKNHHLHSENIEGNPNATPFDSERPVIYYLEEIEKATNNFDKSRIIGKGGYGSVYFGVLGDKVYIYYEDPIKTIMIYYPQ